MPRLNLSSLLLCLWCWVLPAIAWADDGESKQQPNVVVFLSDDLGFRDIGCYDGPVKTPHLDQLASRGVRFTDFYSGCAVCSPSRATLLTGRHHIRTGVYSWISDDRQRSHLKTEETTLAEILSRGGYATGHFGKWHLGLPTEAFDKPTPAEHGFDWWLATANNASPSHRNPDNFIRNGQPLGGLEGYACQLVASEAIGWLKQRDSSQPFFANIWFHEPHAPIAAPVEWVRAYGAVNDKAAIYSGTIANEDAAIGRVIEQLRNMHALDNTLIIYASDNGSYRRDRVGHLRGQKGVNWEGGLRVPGIISWPARISPAVVKQPAGLVDVLPTVCSLVELDRPQGVHLDGADLSPLLLGQASDFERPQPLFWHLQKSRPIVAVRDGDYVMVADPDFDLSTNNMFDEAWIPVIKSGQYTNYQLYNLASDPSQTTNIAQAEPEIFESLKLQLNQINASIMRDGADWHLR